MRVLRQAFEEWLPLHFPVDLHVVGPRMFENYRRHARRMISIDP